MSARSCAPPPPSERSRSSRRTVIRRPKAERSPRRHRARWNACPGSRVVNLARALEQIGEAGFWRIGLAGDAETELKDALGPPRVALVLGAEGPGLRQNTREHCDALARLPITESIESLNVSNAAAVALYAASVA